MENHDEAPDDDVDTNIVKTKLSDDLNKFDVYGTIFTLPARYEVTKPLGSGAYG